MPGTISMMIENEAVRVIDLDIADGVADGVVEHGNAVLIGITDGSGTLIHETAAGVRHLPVARGRINWLEPGTVRVGPSDGAFGRAVIVDILRLPDPPDQVRTFGDDILFTNDTVCVYEETLGPGEVRTMHSHAARFVVPLTNVHIRHRFDNGDEREATNVPGRGGWIAKPITHEVTNIGERAFWAICVEHP